MVLKEYLELKKDQKEAVKKYNYEKEPTKRNRR